MQGLPQYNSSSPAVKRKDGYTELKLKSFCTTKEMVSKLKRPPTEWQKTFTSYTSDK
jgi:hypothetical protein